VSNTFITYPELATYGIPYSRKHLIDLQKTGNFPRAVQLSARRIAWRIRDIEEWVSSRPVARAVAVGDAGGAGPHLTRADSDAML
jgi:predicted DNA-binding transcriptional regulator AlpA